MRPTALLALLALLLAAAMLSAVAAAQTVGDHPGATAAQGGGEDGPLPSGAGAGSAGGGAGGAAASGSGRGADSSGPGGETPGDGPPLTESMSGGVAPAAEEPRLARTGSEALVVALAGMGLLLSGAGLRLRLRA